MCNRSVLQQWVWPTTLHTLLMNGHMVQPCKINTIFPSSLLPLTPGSDLIGGA